MARATAGVVGGFLLWWVLATLLNFGIRAAIPGYAAVERSFDYTMTMMVARLALAVASSLAAGFGTAVIAPMSRRAPWIVGGLLLVLFVPVHIQIGAKLPLWYHLFFLVTLLPLVLLGARLRRV